MFVLKSKYDHMLMASKIAIEKALLERNAWQLAHSRLTDRWNDLVQHINARGGETFLQGEPASAFTDDDLRKLLMLIRPDKHGGKQQAIDMTAKINQLRSKV